MKFLIKINLLMLFSFLSISTLLAQAEEEEKKWALSGYVKSLQTATVVKTPLFESTITDNLIHNRLNFEWFINDNWTFRSDLRTRLFYGEQVKLTADFAKMVDNANNDYFDLSAVLMDKEAWVLHTMLDRLYVQYNKNDWEIRLGRQRINWGISTVWNPNDVFNAFSFTDFDYEERPGSDALLVRYYTGAASSVELAVNAGDSFDEIVAASLIKLNQWNYDFQILLGKAGTDLVFGGGWAGNIKNLGFKGEFSFFEPYEDNGIAAFSATAGLDYAFGNSLYLSAGYLYNSLGTDQSILTLFSFNLSSKNLYPYKNSLFLSASYPFNPLFNGGLSIIYSPSKANALFLSPTLSYSIKENWDIDLISQIAFNDDGMDYNSPLQSFFLRLKWTY